CAFTAIVLAKPGPAASITDAGPRSRRAIVAPELAITRLDTLRVDGDVSGRRACDSGGKIGPQSLQMRRHRCIFLRDCNIAVVILGDPVVEADGFQDRSGRAG